MSVLLASLSVPGTQILLTMDTGGDGEIGFDEFLAFTMALKVGAWVRTFCLTHIVTAFDDG